MEVKAIVLNGSQFLFKAYHALQDEAESHMHAPSFGQTFFESTIKSLNTVRESIIRTSKPISFHLAKHAFGVKFQVT